MNYQNEHLGHLQSDMSSTEPMTKESQYFTFAPSTINYSPTDKREIKIDVSMNQDADIAIIGQDDKCVCCPADVQVHYSFVIFVGMITYAAGFLTCLYFWPR